ncbi:MAG TPA: hypothetical protein PLN56_00855 [Methanoregulaceae archaeon]|nr:MAG: hypothetical protein IPI71_04780 [Methanolinea sp.]HON80803.1 hypothetical protein [Methanoregulaceae archaeon]HPD09538.1 hypothetical protein [Methanoregulaceae archaeon]HRU30244.1 hypothetical protein [Methanoregulaceae archaeon]
MLPLEREKGGDWRKTNHSKGSHQYTTRDLHIGYGEAPPLAIWCDLALTYGPASDTIWIPVCRTGFSPGSHAVRAP